MKSENLRYGTIKELTSFSNFQPDYECVNIREGRIERKSHRWSKSKPTLPQPLFSTVIIAGLYFVVLRKLQRLGVNIIKDIDPLPFDLTRHAVEGIPPMTIVHVI